MSYKRKLKVLIVAPNFIEKWNKLDLLCKENLAISYLSSFLEAYGHDVYMVNAQLENWDNDKVLSVYKDIEFDLIGVSCSPQKLYPASKDFVKKARAYYSNAFLIMGGVFPTMCYREILIDLPMLDAISLGEGEHSLLKVCDKLLLGSKDLSLVGGMAYVNDNGQIVHNTPERIVDLDSLPLPKRDVRAFSYVDGVMAYLIAGKGCYGNCSYCSIRSCFNYNKRICRSPKNVVDEIEQLVKSFGVTHIQFHDDIFYDYSLNGQKWLYNFVTEIKARNIQFTFRIYLRPNDIKEAEIKMLCEIGLKTVFIGAESGVQRILDEMNKKVTPQVIRESIEILKKLNVNIHLGFITLVPTCTFAELKENYDFLYSLGVDIINDANLHNRLNIYNGCEYEEILQNLNLLYTKVNFWDIHSYRFLDPKVQLYHDKLQEIKEYARNTKVFENQLIEYYSKDDFKCKDIKKIGVNLWIKITQLLLEAIQSAKKNIVNLKSINCLIDDHLMLYENMINDIKGE